MLAVQALHRSAHYLADPWLRNVTEDKVAAASRVTVSWSKTTDSSLSAPTVES